MITCGDIFHLWVQGLTPVQIAERLDVSKQRVYQVLSAPSAGRPRKRGLRPLPLDHLKQEEFPTKSFDKNRVGEVYSILKTRRQWTWVEAERALKAQGLRPAASSIYGYLRELGFSKGPGQRAWTRST